MALYVENSQSWSTVSAGVWTSKDLSVSPYNVPPNSVAEICIINTKATAAASGGLRIYDSSIDRIFHIHEAEDVTDGKEYVTAHVKTDASGLIEYYGSVTQINFCLIGHWIDVDYIEKFESFQSSANGEWTNYDLSQYGISGNKPVEIVLANINTSGEQICGVRQTDSILDRFVTLHESESSVADSGQADFATMIVNTDSSGAIQVYADNKDKINFILVGYWSIPPSIYYERFKNLPDLSQDDTWTDLSFIDIPQNSVAEVLLINEKDNTSNEIGLRQVKTTTDRVLNLHEAEAGGTDVGRMHVCVSPSQEIQYYFEDVSDVHSFKLIGYWDLEGQQLNKPQYIEVDEPPFALNDIEYLATSLIVDLNRDWGYNIPSNVVLDLAILNNSEFSLGVILNGHTYWLHKAHDGGVDVLNLHYPYNESLPLTVVDGGDDTTASQKLKFKILGYWQGTEYQLLTGSGFQASTSGIWEQHDLSSWNIPSGSIVDVIIGNSYPSGGRDVGVRSVGSSETRIIRLRKAILDSVYPGTTESWEYISIAVQTDVNNQIEIYTDDPQNTKFTIAGYWVTPPAQYHETYIDIGVPLSPSGWNNKNISTSGIPENSVIELGLSNKDVNTERYVGSRECITYGRSTQRWFELQEAEPTPQESEEWDGSDWGRMHVSVNSNGNIQYYSSDPDLQNDFIIFGYWSSTETTPEENRRLQLLHGNNAIFYHPLNDRTEFIHQENWAGQLDFVSGQVGNGCTDTSGSISAYGSGLVITSGYAENSSLTVHSLEKIDENKAIILYITDDPDVSGSNILVANILSIDGTTVSAGDPLILDSGISVPSYRLSHNFTYFGNNSGIVVYTPDSSGSKAVVLIVSDTTVSSGANLYLGSGVKSDIDYLDSNRAIIASLLFPFGYDPTTTASSGELFIVEISGTSLIKGESAYFATEQPYGLFAPQIRRISDDKACLFWSFGEIGDESLRGCIVDIADLAATTYPSKPVIAGHPYIELGSFVVLSESGLIVFYTIPDYPGLRGNLAHGTYAKFGTIYDNTLYFDSSSLDGSIDVGSVDNITASSVIIHGDNRYRYLNLIDNDLGKEIYWENNVLLPENLESPKVIALSQSKILTAGIVAGGTPVDPLDNIYIYSATIDNINCADIDGYVYKHTANANSVTFAFWSNCPCSGTGKIVLERGHRLTLQDNKIFLNLTDQYYATSGVMPQNNIYYDQISGAVRWSGSNITNLISTLNDGDNHLLIVDFRYQESGIWNLRTSLDGNEFFNHEAQNSGVKYQLVSDVFDTDGRIGVLSQPSGAFIDEAIMWIDTTLFTDRELNNLYELSHTHGASMDQYYDFFGTPCSGSINLFTSGVNPPITSNIDLYIKGPILSSSGVDLFIAGPYPTSGNIDLYIAGPVPISSGITLYAQGPMPVSSGIDLFIKGPMPMSSGISLYTIGPLAQTSSVDLYSYGFDILSGSISLYIHNRLESTIDLYVFGCEFTSDTLPLFIEAGENQTWTLYLQTADNDINDNIKLFTYGSTESGVGFCNNNIELFLDALNADYPYIDSEFWPLYLCSSGVPQATEIWSLFLNADTKTTDSLNLYTYGHASGSPPHGPLMSDYISLMIQNIPTHRRSIGFIPKYQNWSMFLKVHQGSYGNVDLYISGCPAPATALSGYSYLYTNGMDIFSGSQTLYIYGISGIIQSGIDLFIDAIGVYNMNGYLYTHGY